METEIAYPQRNNIAGLKSQVISLNILLITAFCIELLSPFLIDKGYLPPQVRWLSHALITLILCLCIARMILFNHIPFSVVPILGIVAIWSFVAIARGQGIATTLWGVLLLFQFVFVGLFVYLDLNLPTRLAPNLRKAAMVILILQLASQLLQYGSGVKPGDGLAGLFTSGGHGTSDSIMFILLLNCLFLGNWIATRQWKGLVASLVIGVICGVLGEVKLYPFVIAVLSIMAVILFTIRYRSFIKMLLFVVLIFSVMFAYLYLYNLIIPTAGKHPLQEFITNPQYLQSYLNQTNTKTKNGNTHIVIRRGDALALGWNSLVEDRNPITFLFGYGIGARSESKSLGTTGIGFSSNEGGIDVGTSLLVMMQEMGTVGLAAFVGFIIWVVFVMVRDIYRYPHSPNVELRYALLLFSILWPIWIWYTEAWTRRVPMLLYWILLGYLLAETLQPLAKIKLRNR